LTKILLPPAIFFGVVLIPGASIGEDIVSSYHGPIPCLLMISRRIIGAGLAKNCEFGHAS